MPPWNKRRRLLARWTAMSVAVVAATGTVWTYLFRRDVGGWIEVNQLVGINATLWHPVAIDARYALVSNYIYAVGESFALPDYAEFQACFGPTDPIDLKCERFDLEADGRIDLADQALLLQTFRGP